MLPDNHDIPRIASVWLDGAELGMTGGADPAKRGPMRWDRVAEANPELVRMRRLIALRQQHRALRVGDCRVVESERLFAFERHTDRALDTRRVVVNPVPATLRERLMVANPDLRDDTPMVDVLGLVPALAPPSFGPGFVQLELPPHSAVVLQPQPKALGGCSRYKRVS